MDRRPFVILGGSLIIAGAILAFLAFTFFRLSECGWPGGCRELPVIYWPWLVPGIVLIAAGITVVGAGQVAWVIQKRAQT